MTTPSAQERADLLEALSKHRTLLRHTTQGLTDEQAAARPTVSSLSLGGLVKHVTAVERQWSDFVTNGPQEDALDWSAVDWSDPPPEVLAYQDGFRMVGEETLASLLADWDDAAAATDALVRSVDLDMLRPLPRAPWSEPGASWSALDGQKSMG
jgi:uncharacterized damage-inducible protein DinB